MKKVLPLLALVALAVALPMCDSAAVDYCDAWCDCEGCSDHEYDDCIHDGEHDADHAYDHDCGVEWEDYVACVADTYHCHDHQLEADCKHEHDDWKDCM